ncbi:MAG: glycosyltransferase family 9 protein [Rhabdochlamydiaceae bacterium]
MKILIVKTSAIGDVIQTFDILPYLKQKYSDLKIDWLAEANVASLVENHPLVDEVKRIETKKWRTSLFSFKTLKEIYRCLSDLRRVRYDYLIDLQGNTKSALFTFFAQAKNKIGFDKTHVAEILNLLVTNKKINISHVYSKQFYLNALLNLYEDPSYVKMGSVSFRLSLHEHKELQFWQKNYFLKDHFIVFFGSAWENKKLSLDTLKNFLKNILAKDLGSLIIVWGSGEEKPIAESIQTYLGPKATILGGYSLSFLQNIMKEVKGVIGIDSALLHLCGTTKTPSFSIFGPSSADFYKPIGEEHIAFQGACPYDQHFYKRCPLLRTCVSGNCIKSISAEKLTEVFLSEFYPIIKKKQS